MIREIAKHADTVGLDVFAVGEHHRPGYVPHGFGHKRRAGSAAAVNETAFKLGGSLGVAVLGSVVTGHLTGRMSTESAARDLPAFASESITGAIETAARLGGQSGDALARGAFVAGFADAALIAAGLALAVAFLTALFLTDPHHRDLEEKLE
ncbi:hypothetical protein [Nonomuraea sp. CA-141351]|uniref:hypothetical protein n=1 Tax=Nonomuraea sp. CA-141351 TaxID=3239996 RepID=UPI003D92AB48